MAKTGDALGLAFSLVALVPLWWTLGVAADVFSQTWFAPVLLLLRVILLAGPLIFLYGITQDIVGSTAKKSPPGPQGLTDQHVADATAAAIEHGVDPAMAIAAVAEHLAQAGTIVETTMPQPPPPKAIPALNAQPDYSRSNPTSAAMKGAKAVWSVAVVVASGLLICGIAFAAFVIYLLSQMDCFLGC